MRRLVSPLLSRASSRAVGVARCHDSELFAAVSARRGFHMKMLAEDEQETLASLLYHEHYRPEGASAGDPRDATMWYSAKMELKWLADWAMTAHPKASPEEIARIVKLSVLQRVDEHKPLSYIIGSQPFFGVDIICQPPLLIPRTETEMMVHWLWSTHLRPTPRAAMAKTEAAAAVNSASSVPECIADDEAPRSVKLPRHGHSHSDGGQCHDHGHSHGPAGQCLSAASDNASPEPTPQPASEEPAQHSRLFVLDMCCGTGCIGVALAAKNRDLLVTSVDISPVAIETTTRNAARNGVGASVTAVLSDMFTALPRGNNSKTRGNNVLPPDGLYDLIVSNPPYILDAQYEGLPPTVKQWEDRRALLGDARHSAAELTYYRELCDIGHTFLRKPTPKPLLSFASYLPFGQQKLKLRRPSIVMEVGLQAEKVATLFDNSPLWEDVELHQDRFKQPRWITALAK